REAAWAEAYNLAADAYQSGRLTESIALFEQADRLSRKWPYALVVLGWLYGLQGDDAKALNAYRAALEVFEGGVPADAAEEQAAEWRARHAEAVQEAGRLLAVAGETAEAEAVYRAFLEVSPGHVGAMIGLAQVVGGEEADRLYAELVEQEGLSEEQLFRVGAGLYEAGRYDGAVEAFRKAVALNPFSRDAHFNLAQSLYQRARQLQSDEGAGPPPAELRGVLEQMIHASEQTRAVDPNNRDLFRMLAYSYRGLGDMAGDQAEKARWEAEVAKVAQEYEAVAFEIYDIGFAREDTGIRMSGALENLKLAEGETVRLRVSVLGDDGAVLGSDDVEVRAPAPGETVAFSTVLAVPGTIRGWKYEVVTLRRRVAPRPAPGPAGRLAEVRDLHRAAGRHLWLAFRHAPRALARGGLLHHSHQHRLLHVELVLRQQHVEVRGRRPGPGRKPGRGSHRADGPARRTRRSARSPPAHPLNRRPRCGPAGPRSGS